MRARFVKSEFRGLLPGQYAEGGGWWEGTWRVPEGMNDENLEDVGKYVSSPFLAGLGAEGKMLTMHRLI